jgi:hypothetical protein
MNKSPEIIGDSLLSRGVNTGSEKELHAEFGCIVLFDPLVTVPALLRLFHTPASEELLNNMPSGSWRGYRLSTRRLRGSGYGTPMGFPGVAGCGGIADVGLFLNPTFDGKGGSQMQAERVLLFEIKSQDHHPHKESQLRAHLRAIERDDQSRSTFLGAVGGRRVHIQHPRWLGHVGLNDFLADMGPSAAASMVWPRCAVRHWVATRKPGRCSFSGRGVATPSSA